MELECLDLVYSKFSMGSWPFACFGYAPDKDPTIQPI
jgi:hypothetical protein